MTKDSRSFFERLTGAVKVADEEEILVDQSSAPDIDSAQDRPERQDHNWDHYEDEEMEEEEGTLSVDLYETPTDLILKTVVAGCRPDDLDISISRERVSIRGKRIPDRYIKDSDTHLQELYWGSFSRTLSLPAEIEADEAEAVSIHGLLEIKLPKINKDKETKLRVKTK